MALPGLKAIRCRLPVINCWAARKSLTHTSRFAVFGPKPQCQTDRKLTRLFAVLVTNHFAGSWHRLSAAEPTKDPSAAASSGQLGISCKVLVGAKSAANSHQTIFSWPRGWFLGYRRGHQPSIREKVYVESIPQNMPITTNAIAIVQLQPNTLSPEWMTKEPIIFSCDAINIMMNMIGTAMTPLTTALQSNALMGSIGAKQINTPNNVAALMML